MCKGEDQCTSENVEPVTDGQASLLATAIKNYPGGKERLELAKGHPYFKKSLHRLFDRLAEENEARVRVTKIPCWMQPYLGLCKTSSEYRKVLKQNDFSVLSGANYDLESHDAFKVSGQIGPINLVRVTTAELGFPKGATLRNIYSMAQFAGLTLCPPEVAPALRLIYLEQPVGEEVVIGMKPIDGGPENPIIFAVAHDYHLKSRCVTARWGYWDDCLFPSDCIWVFVRPSN